MAKIARSASPIFLTVGRATTLPFTMMSASGMAIDLSGAIIAASFNWQIGHQDLTVSIIDAVSGRFSVFVPADVLNQKPLSKPSRLVVSFKDSAGTSLDMVWPIVGETP